MKNVEIITVAKVGSANFLNGCKLKYPTKHGHSLLRLKEVITDTKDCCIITGIRNPIDRNLSYLFQTMRDDFHNDVKTRNNEYKGELCHISKFSKIDIENIEANELVKCYFEMDYHETFNQWFEEFFEITKINDKSFDRHKGLGFYNLINNNILILYTLEKLDDNEDEICNFLGIDRLENINDSNKRKYVMKYREVKKIIKYKKEYLDKLLRTNIMDFFYLPEMIKEIYDKYEVKD